MTTAVEKRRNNRRIMNWKRRAPLKAKLTPAQRLEDPEVRRKQLAEFLAGHEHRCINCPKKYKCTNACDPVAEGLDTSICPGCFEKERHPC